MKWLAGVFLEKLIRVLIDSAQAWWRQQQAIKKAKQDAKKEIKKIKEETKDDPKERARRIGDMLKR